jgi:hypothetical protein
MMPLKFLSFDKYPCQIVHEFYVNAFSKAASLTNVSDATPKPKKCKQANSANTTPTNSKKKGISAIINKITQSEKKKDKADLKKAKVFIFKNLLFTLAFTVSFMQLICH